MDPLQELIDQAADLTALTDDQLAELLTAIRAEADSIVATDATDADLVVLEAAKEVVGRIVVEQDTRQAAADERADRAHAAITAIRGDEGDPDPEVDSVEDADDPADTPADPEPVAAEETEEPEAIAAAATPPVRVSRVAARRPPITRPRPATTPQFSLVASANVPGVTAGSRLDTAEALTAAFRSAFDAIQGYRGGMPTNLSVARLVVDYPEDRILGRDAITNGRRIHAVTSPQAITAAGGICAPSTIDYSLPGIGSDVRPFRDQMLTRFGADRGGIVTFPPPVLGDLSASVTVWTETNDSNPADPATKPCLTVTCPSQDETLVDAIVSCVQFGNFRARFWPEQITEWMRLAAVEHARIAETRLMTTVGTGSTQVTTGQNFGAARDVLAELDKIIPQYISRHYAPDTRWRFGAPFWLRNMMRADLVRELPGSSDERLATADATIDSFFAVRGVNPTWLIAGEAGQVYGAQGDGPANGWLSTAVTYLYPEGSWLFLDGGTLDLGLVRDSTLNSTNDVRMFMETFEAAHFHGVESLRITMDLCPSGESSTGVDLALCATGS